MSKSKKQVDKAEDKPRGYEDTFELPEAELTALAEQIRRDLLQAEEDKQTWLQERLLDVRAYFGIKKQTDWPFKGAAKVSSRMHQIMVDTMAANLVSSAVAPEKIIDVRPSNSESIENAKYVSDLQNTLARYEYNLPQVLDRAWQNALIESFVVLKPVYHLETSEIVTTVKRWLPKEYEVSGINYDLATDTVTDRDGKVVPSLDIGRLPEDPAELKKLGLHECTIEVTKEVIKEGVKIYSLPGSDVFVPISAPGETPFEKYQRSPYVIQQEYVTTQEMKMLQQQGKIKNFDLFGQTLAENLYTEQLRHEKEQQVGYLDIDKHLRYLNRNIWWYGKYEYKGKLRELVVLMNHDTGVIMKVQVNQFGVRPFFPQVPFPVDGTPFGESLPKRIRSLVSELELVLNTLINMGLIKAYPPKFFDPNSGFDPKTLGNFGPNAYVPVRDPSRNVFLPPQPEDPRVLMDMAKLLMDLIERATANSDAVQGQTSPTANTTAFEVQQALVRAGVRFDIVYKRLKDQLKPMFGYIHQLLLRHMPYEKEVRVMGEQGAADGGSRLYAINQGQVQGKYHFDLTGNSLTEEQAAAQKAEKLFMMMNQDPYLSYKPESPYYLRFNLIKYYNPVMMDKILPKPEEVAQLLRDRHQVQNEQENKAVSDAQGANGEAQQAQAELQMKQQQMQMDMQVKAHQVELESQARMQDMKLKEKEHDQKMRQMEEAHKLKLELMKESANAKAKEKPADNQKS
jgi:hypothetical protein